MLKKPSKLLKSAKATKKNEKNIRKISLKNRNKL